MPGLLDAQGLLEAPTPRVDPFGGYQGLLSANQAATVPGSGVVGNAQRAMANVAEQPLLHRAAMASMPIPVVGDVLGLANDAAWMIADPDRRTWLDFAGAGLGALPFVPSAAMTVFHGSPHLFKELPGHPFGKFDHSKMGSGEGAQAYGWGTYLAENPGTAKSYMLAGMSPSQQNVKIGGRPIHEMHEQMQRLADAAPAASKEAQDLYDRMMILENLDAGRPYKQLLSEMQDYPGIHDETLSWLEGLDIKQPGNLYNVDLPDEQIAKMLDWDAPLSEQPEAVREALLSTRATKGPPDPSKMSEEKLRTTLEKIDPNGNYRFWEDAPDEVLTKDDLLDQWEMLREYDPEGFDSYFGSAFLENQPGHGILHQIEAETGSPAATSALLKKAGIPGIKFLDGPSRAKGEGTRNFVLFDEDLAKIIGRE